MPIQGITNASGPVIGAQATSSEDIDKLDFMNLLIAQIKNQDPLSPMDNQEFIAQLTQFTSLQEMQDMKSTLEEGVMLSQSLNNTMLLGLVGRSGTVAGDKLTLTDGGATRNQVQATQTGTAVVRILDAAGVEISTYQVAVQRGMNDITWDGLTEDGQAAPDGLYTVEVTVTDPGGEEMEAATFMTGPIDSIQYENNLAIVEINGQQFYVSEILEVRT